MAQRRSSISTWQAKSSQRRSVSITYSSCDDNGEDDHHSKSKSYSEEPNMNRQKQDFTHNRKFGSTLSSLRTFDNNEEFLSDQEQKFQDKRKLYIQTALRKQLNTDLKVDDVPHIGLMGSGGGYRAMVAMSGNINALYDTKILDYILYTAVLSGSSWFISTLYSHPEWPNIHPKDIQNQLKNDISKNPKSISKILTYGWDWFCKKWNGKSWNITTDVFGPMLGDVLIPKRMSCRWSEQRDKLSEGTVPLPLLSAIHAKEEKNTKEFHEWVEFSPYEVSIQHYGAAIDMTNFGSKFDKGLLTQRFDEIPLFEIMGICGSAYTLTHEELLNKDSTNFKTVEKSADPSSSHETNDIEIDSQHSINEGYYSENDDVFHEEDETYGFHQPNISTPSIEELAEMEELFKRICHIRKQEGRKFEEETNGNEKDDFNDEANVNRGISKFMHSCSLEGDVEIDGAFDYPKTFVMEQCMKTRRHRAAMVNNPFWNVSFDETDSACPQGKPTSSPKNLMKNDLEKLCLIDAGLAFNSPYPLLFQPGRDVDLILSFDFTDRKKDSNEPFKTILTAEDWARKHDIKFPKINIDMYEGKDVQELYVFEDENDPECPIIMHFVLVNKDFRLFKKPGVERRESEKENCQFANFTIYDDQKTFHCTNFQYSEENFDRLSQLSEFIVLNNTVQIEACIKKSIKNKQKRQKHERKRHVSSPV
ncbi:cytosolic phospholipase A2-like isoform X4 [Mytilus edulis]|uniref:cytosolic phospholipase A2-like isoform X4 n=1 Tax=Mytilus edulis TaxID=6550 RepID=UPI0039EE34BC